MKPVLRGSVIHGAGRGLALGYPTANLDVPESELPESGIYAAWVRRPGDSRWHPGAASVGTNPTFGERGRRLEVYLLDYRNGDLYGQTLEVVLAARLRPERLFPSPEDLVRQMKRDCRAALRALRSLPPPG